MEFLIKLLEHPWIILMICTTLCVLVGQTYDFILTIFGKKTSDKLNDDKMNRELMMDKECNTRTQEYVYDDNIKGVYE